MKFSNSTINLWNKLIYKNNFGRYFIIISCLLLMIRNYKLLVNSFISFLTSASITQSVYSMIPRIILRVNVVDKFPTYQFFSFNKSLNYCSLKNLLGIIIYIIFHMIPVIFYISYSELLCNFIGNHLGTTVHNYYLFNTSS